MSEITIKRNNMPSHYEIFNYWKTKIINSNYEVKDYNKEETEGFSVVTDWGEPSCWCCGEPANGDEEKYMRALEEGDFKSIWNDKKVKSKLERCHIVPHSLGGGEIEENLFLLCKKCHKQSPDTISSKMFFAWVINKNKKCAFGVNLIDVKKYNRRLCRSV